MTLTCLRILAVATALACATASAAAAEAPAAVACGDRDGRDGRPPPDHDKARAALARGEVVPLRRVLEAVERQVPGDILKIELAPGADGALIYRLKILARDGRVVKQCLDARSGAFLSGCPEQH